MTTGQINHPPAPWRAVILGGSVALVAVVAALALARWSIGGWLESGTTERPVAEGIVLLAASTAAALLAVLAWGAALGVATLVARQKGEHARATLPTGSRLAARSSAVLLALTISAPVAQAGAVPSTTTTTTSAQAQVDGATQVATAHVPIWQERDAPSSRADNDSDPVPLPGWRPTGNRPTAQTPLSPTSAAPTSASDASPTLPAPTAAVPFTAPGRVRDEVSDGVVVTRGDTLWSIASADLGPGATLAQISALWPRWYEANRLEIGPDPDLILPGQILHPPSTSGALP